MKTSKEIKDLLEKYKIEVRNLYNDEDEMWVDNTEPINELVAKI